MPKAEKYLSPTIFRADFVGAKALARSYRLVTARQAGFKEGWLQRAIAENVELVFGPCRAGRLIPHSEEWWFWESEVSLKDAGESALTYFSFLSMGGSAS